MSKTTRPTNAISPSEQVLPEHEQELLDTALQESDQLLARSLHDDEARRKRKRLAWLSALVVGGVFMSTVFLGILAGWFAVAEPGVAEVEQVRGPSDKQWQRRLLALKEGGRWYEGANAGMELVRVPGDRPYEILKANWPNIATSARKQILKGFTPGMMGNKEVHARFFDVMHLGMTDPDADVRSYAATYIEMQGLPNFLNHAGGLGYAEWRKQVEHLTAEKIIANDDPALRGWSMFFGGRMKIAERLFRKALKDDPNNLSATNGLGFILLNQGDHEQAKPMFEKVLAKQKDAGGPMNGLARCLKAEGKVDEAIALWEQAAKQNPGAVDVFANLAQTYLERKEYAKSAKYFKILTKSQPDNEAIRDGLLAAVEGLIADE